MRLAAHLGIALHHGNHIAADGLGHLHEHQADRASADHGDRVADLYAGFVQAAQHASQRLGHGCIFETNIRRNRQHVGFDDAPRNANVFRIGAVVEKQIFAKIFLVLGAVEAHAGRARSSAPPLACLS